MKRIKIVKIALRGDPKPHEENLEQLVNQGWEILCGGGGSGQYTPDGFVVLQKET